MAFTYNFNTYPYGSWVRLLIMDTDASKPIFDDDEINQFLYLPSSQAIYQSSQANPTGNSVAAPVMVYSVYRSAALALLSLGSNSAYLSSIAQILDVKLDNSKATSALKSMAQSYFDMADNDGSYAIAEWVQDQFSARERVIKQWLRIFGGG
jgi:serine protease inhibitor